MKRLLSAAIAFSILLPTAASAARFTHYEWYWDAPPSKHRESWSALMRGRIASGRLEGFSVADATVTETRVGWPGNIEEPETYLRREGGMLGSYYWLSVRPTGDAADTEIRTPEQLRTFFGPVGSREEAVSFVAALTPDLKMGRNDVPVGHVTAIEGGYLVHVLRRNTFGCGVHRPSWVLFRVGADGSVTELAAQRLTGEGILCVD